MTAKENRPKMVLRMDKKEGMMRTDICFLAFFDSCVVCSVLPSKRRKEETEALKKQLKADGIGLLKSKIILTKFFRGYGDKYYRFTMQQMLNDYEENYMIPYEEIHQLKFLAAIVDDNETLVHEGKLEIRSDRMKAKFYHDYEDEEYQIKSVLSKVLSFRLKYKKEIIRGFAERRLVRDMNIRQQLGS